MVTRIPNTNTGAANRSQASWSRTRQPTDRAGPAGVAGALPTAANAPLVGPAQQGTQRAATAATGHTADRPQQPGTATRRLSDQQLLMRLQVANNLLGAGFKQVTGQPAIVQHKQMLKLYTGFIDAADDLSPRLKTRAGVGNSNLAGALTKRASSRYVVSQECGLLKDWGDQLIAFGDSSRPMQMHTFPRALDAMLDTADLVVDEARANLQDLRRSIALDPPGSELTLHDEKLNVSLALMARSNVALMKPMTLCTNECLERVIGGRADALVEQEMLLNSALYPMVTHREALNTERWAHEMRPVLKDAAIVSQDLVALAIDISLPEPGGNLSAEDIQQARARIDCNLRCCSELWHLIDEWQKAYANVGLEQRRASATTLSDLQAGDFVSVLAPSGMHVPATVQTNGQAILSGPQGLRFEQLDGEFRAIDDASADVGPATEAEADNRTSSKPPSLKLAKAVKKAEDLLTQDLGKASSQWMARKGVNNPDLVMPAYRLQAEKWQKQAEQMTRMAGRLEVIRSSRHTPDDSVSRLDGLAERLREQAAAMVNKAQELTRPQTRWALIKAYVRPQASQMAELLAAGQIHQVRRPEALRSNTEPGKIFEARIQLKNDEDGTSYPPVWLHLHAKRPMSVAAVCKGRAEDFDAVHLKSDIEKNRGLQWVEAQRASGRYDAEVHRSPVGADLLKGLMQWGAP